MPINRAGISTKHQSIYQQEILMKIIHSVIVAMSVGAVLAGCGGGGLPEVNAVNCSGRGMEAALSAFSSDTESERQAFVEGCEALSKSN